MKKSMLAIVFLVGGAVLMSAQINNKVTETKAKTDVKVRTPPVSQSNTVELQAESLKPEMGVQNDTTIKMAPDSTQNNKVKNLRNDKAIRKTDVKASPMR